ncbi:DUF1514 family protein [Staphylococcus simiae]|uniref:DUF1514 domain-containing protein n=1 Tax=Staphylococcus simiae CCM 7213 = CCUG 51256 TaxID=911238 RepID=G5JH77_9STAP|nr:DUF1514 family protein [Staphylococcus simiae]EHJ08425.1 hypothetical protein SS7213T_04030 [Staphylococcus simiae CCM 7213 = CCUG 51256]PNZ12620.1 DUF1514 domain-containing protein [Staphylococcus simiae]SNV67230.1 phage protein [Staphylococcus simiae]
MWLIIAIVLAVIVLILIANNGMLRNENESLRYANVYLFTRFVRDNGEQGIIELEEAMEDISKKFK